jgi:hypothetical protein
MNTIQNLNISETDKVLLEKSAKDQKRFLGLEYSILAHDENSITILVRQKRLINDTILSSKELHERGKAFLKVPSLSENISIHVRPIVYNVTESEVVTATWIQQKMKLHSLKTKHLVEMLGIDKSTLSVLVSGNANLTKWHKATFYYFFKSLGNG